MNRCEICVMPDTRPDTRFAEGICSACLAYAERDWIDWDTRKKNLEAILSDHSGEADYDCIVPSSGGKDSTWQVLKLIEIGAKPLVVTAATCHLTPIGRRNIDNLARYADTVEIAPNRTVRAKLNRIALETVGDISWPEHVLIHTTPFNIAVKLGIPLVFYGENPTNQYGGPSEERQAEQQMSRQWVSEFGGFLGMRVADFIGLEGITAADMLSYCGPTDHALDAVGVEVYFLGQFLPWDSHENARVAKDAGMAQCLPSPANLWPHENLDNAQTGIHDHLMFLKYGYGRGCAQASVDVRMGLRTRESALAWVEKHDGELARNYAGVPLEDILEPLGLTVPRFRQILEDYRRQAA